MAVEFISAVNVNPGDELNRLGRTDIDLPFFTRYVNALEDAGFDYTLCAYASSFQDQFAIANQIVARSERVTPIVALRPNTIYPTVAAKALATLDQFGAGRAVVHFISGGSDAEQAREGDHLPKEQRYARTAEYIDIVRRVWTSTEPFSHEGDFYKFENFVSLVRPTNGTIPVSVGGSSAEAYQVGGSRADIFGLWGEPLADTQDQIGAVHAEARRAGREDRPRIWLTFRPIIAATEELAWEKARRIRAVL
jgi:alkanesulfonate monooxygenase